MEFRLAVTFIDGLGRSPSQSGRVVVKVSDHLGDEVVKVFRVG